LVGDRGERILAGGVVDVELRGGETRSELAVITQRLRTNSRSAARFVVLMRRGCAIDFCNWLVLEKSKKIKKNKKFGFSFSSLPAKCARWLFLSVALWRHRVSVGVLLFFPTFFLISVASIFHKSIDL
jgi:hypothetical protein